jgi:hypothetical protein
MSNRNDTNYLIWTALEEYPHVSDRTIRKLMKPVVSELERIEKRNAARAK